jgi:hypothetical protein
MSYALKPAPGKKFMKRTVEQITEEIIRAKIEGKSYAYEDSLNWSKELSADILAAIQTKCDYERYKIVVQVSIAEACQQGMRVSSRCLWNPDTDNFAECTVSTEAMHCTALVFGLYWP